MDSDVAEAYTWEELKKSNRDTAEEVAMQEKGSKKKQSRA